MKITIESYENGEIEVKLNWNGKDYIEKWEDGGTYCKNPIEAQMEKDDINAEGTIIEDVLSSLETELIAELADNERVFN